MSNPKVLGSADLAAATPTNIIVPLTVGAVFHLRFVNRGNSSVTIRAGFSSASATLQNSKLIAYDRVLAAKDETILKGLAMGPSTYLVVQSSAVSVNAIAYGIEV